MKKPPDKKDEAVSSYLSYVARIGKEKIPCYAPSVGSEELKLVTDVLQRNWLSESKYTREFESKLAGICGRKYAVCFSNATAALISGMKGLGLGDGDELSSQVFRIGRPELNFRGGSDPCLCGR